MVYGIQYIKMEKSSRQGEKGMWGAILEAQNIDKIK